MKQERGLKQLTLVRHVFHIRRHQTIKHCAHPVNIPRWQANGSQGIFERKRKGAACKKRKPNASPGHDRSIAKFIVGWVVIWWLALLAWAFADLNSWLASLDYDIEFLVYKVAFFAILSALQLLWVRRQLRVRLQRWIPLALLGALAGTVASMLLHDHVIGPHLPTYYNEVWNLPLAELVPIMRLKYTADYFASGTLLWSLPLIFQWAALRKHFRHHALWLLAAVAHNPFTVSSMILFIQLPHVAEVHRELGISWGPEAPDSTLLLDFTIPSLVTGLVLYWILTRRQLTSRALGLQLFQLGRRDPDSAALPPELTIRP